MSTSAVQLLTAMLTVATTIGTIALVVLSVAARRGRPTRLVDTVAAHQSLLCALIAGGAMAGSLYFSEVAHYVPCTLCWYQRIAMYSLAAVALTATIRREAPRPYFVMLAAVGAPISGYHWLLERFPDLDTGACSATLPCTLVWFEEFGFVTLPLMALSGFVAVLAICLAPPKEPT